MGEGFISKGLRGWWGQKKSEIDIAQFTPPPSAGYLVGGAVRDTLLNRPVRDYDWLVEAPRLEAERAAVKLGGHAFCLDERRDHWRVVTGELTRDYTPLGELESDLKLGDVEKNLRARDYTVNAVAADLGGQLIDPTGGITDLKAKRLRMVSEANLQADPVRGLRGVRLAATLAFNLDTATEAAIKRHAALLKSGEALLPAWERVGDELAQLLLSDNAAPGFGLLHRVGLLQVYLPELAAADGVTQGGFHHLDVLGHSLEALHQLVQGFPDADLSLRWATLLHDVGKPETKAFEPDGMHYHFYGHDKLGAELTRGILGRLRVPTAATERAAQLVRYHMVQLPKNDREARRFVHRRRALLPDLLKLMIADREAARGPMSSEASRRGYKLALARVLEIMNEAPPKAPLLNGLEVMQLLNLSPGPRVGEAVRLVHEAEAVGDVKTKAEAEAALRHYAEVQGW